MSWVQETVSEFGKRMGLEGLALDGNGLLELQLQSGGMLVVQQVRRNMVDEVVVYLGRPLGFEAPELLRRALVQSHFSAAHATPVQIALRGEGPDTLLLMLVRIPERDFTLHVLSQTVDALSRWFDGVRRV